MEGMEEKRVPDAYLKRLVQGKISFDESKNFTIQYYDDEGMQQRVHALIDGMRDFDEWKHARLIYATMRTIFLPIHRLLREIE
ncbi:MAG: hypothetical protein Greene041619_647 [Candidatus Peregrinibacteria bacterium Greene0416_19]|nr:MAG: hypothetical protein Greene041619_647 [Candidatus Peregrinibacteria bacterium Greene0416_19]